MVAVLNEYVFQVVGSREFGRVGLVIFGFRGVGIE